MARPKNPLTSDKLRITITPQLREELEMLVQTGRYGMNVNEAIHRLISEAVAAAFEKGRVFLEQKRAVAELLESQSVRSKGK